jgi:deoxyhypusine synthase
MSINPLSLDNLSTVPLAKRKSDSDEQDFGAPYRQGDRFSDFLCSLPNLGAVRDLFSLRDAIVSAKRQGKPVIVGCGGHVIDAGLTPLLNRLIELRIISGMALTGAALLQDVEIALSGHTVGRRPKDENDGVLRISQETGILINEAIAFGAGEGWGIGRSVGSKLLDAEDAQHLDHSLLATAARHDIPATVHPAIGADAFNLHPAAHGESLGATGMTDFRLLVSMMAAASGGVVINVASDVILPYVFQHAVDAARNLGHSIEKMSVAVIDQAGGAHGAGLAEHLSHPKGHGYRFTGPDEIIVPLLFSSVLEILERDVA